jgi:ribonuclease HII
MLQPFYQNRLIEAGCDEAGRGCYAGPVFAAAVILPNNFHHPLLNDSKQLSEPQRYLLRPIIETEAIAFAVAQCSVEEIDTINILKASFTAMHKAIAQLNTPPGLLLIDGNRFISYKKIPHQCIIKGDGLYASIAAASVLAKTYRDDCMLQLHPQFPQYGWNKNKGYGTAQHRAAIAAHGICPHHRKSFNIIPAQQELFKAG